MGEQREREGFAVEVLSPRPGNDGGAMHLIAWIDGERAARRLLTDQRKTTTWGAGLGPGWAATSCAAWQISEREERSWAGLGQERKREIFFLYPLFYFCFFVFKTFAQFEFTQECKTTL
jgi:hypothetical protein